LAKTVSAKTLSAVIFTLTACFQLAAQTEFPKPAGLAPTHGYSQVVVAGPGKLVFLSGQVAEDGEGKLVGKDDLAAQTAQVFENLKTALSSAGATFDDVVKITWYVKGYKPEYLPTLRQVRDRYVNKAAPPASTLVGVASLLQDQYLLEVDAVAAVPEKSPAANKAAENKPGVGRRP
jgi:enamine deaminase RidA (YjgF/YER057c/UK114 family)